MTYCFHCASEGHDPINCWLAPTQPEQGYGQLAIRDMKPNYNISFHNNGQEIGKLDFNGPALVFTGDADESAKVFFDFIAESFKARLEQERADEREKCGVVAEQAAREAIVFAMDAEREACAQLCEDQWQTAHDIQDAIRARSNT